MKEKAAELQNALNEQLTVKVTPPLFIDNGTSSNTGTVELQIKDYNEFKTALLKALLTDEEKLKLIVSLETSTWCCDATRRKTLRKILPWKDFEKGEYPKDNSAIISLDENDNPKTEYYINKLWDNLMSEMPHLYKRKWIYKDELLKTLPRKS